MEIKQFINEAHNVSKAIDVLKEALGSESNQPISEEDLIIIANAVRLYIPIEDDEDATNSERGAAVRYELNKVGFDIVRTI